MEVRIQLDHTQVDYAEINRKILEKIEDLTYDDIVKRYSINDAEIERMVLSKLNNELSGYLIRNNWSSDQGITKIRDVSYTYLQSKLHPMIDKVIKEIGSEKILEIILNYLPHIIWNYMTEKMETYNASQMSKDCMIQTTFNNIKAILESRGIYEEFRSFQ